ncbi:hypothetical protein CBS101457_001213 [Exobasidium rhododendri]|nr:hypothetical protein CBS101457_001213 [Exobasidium rhododendri]
MDKRENDLLPVSLSHTLTPHKGPVHVARLNSLGRYLLTAGADRQIHLFNVTSSATPETIKSYSAHSGGVLSIDIASNNGTFVSGGEDRNVLQWDVGAGSILRRFSAHTGAIQVVQYCGAQGNPNDVLLTAGFDSTLRFYDLRARGAWKPVMECKEAKDTILCAAVRESSIWTGSVDGVVRTYDIRSGQLQQDTMDRAITSITPTINASSLLVSLLARQGSSNADHVLLDLSDGTHLQTIEGGLNVHYRCRSLLSVDDGTILAGDEQGRVRAWDVLSGKAQRFTTNSASSEHSKAILWIEATQKEGGRVVTAGADGVVKVWQRQLTD